MAEKSILRDEQQKPGSKSYIELISDIQKGQIKVPKFQRDFVWSLDKTAKLLDSIIKGYPIWTFILWETSERLNDIKNIGNLELPLIPDWIKVQYVLDWQQRITSLYAAYLGAEIQKEWEKKITDYKEIFVDLEKDFDWEEQIVTDEKPIGLHISLHKVLNSLNYDDEIEEKYDRDYRKKIRQYASSHNLSLLNTSVIVNASSVDGVHLDADMNEILGQAISLFIKESIPL